VNQAKHFGKRGVQATIIARFSKLETDIAPQNRQGFFPSAPPQHIVANNNV